MDATKQLSQKLKILREINNFTQEYVANALDISQNQYSLIEKGTQKLTIDRLEKLAKLYKMELVDMLQLNEQTFIHTITHSQGVCCQQVTINGLTDQERKLYEDSILRLEQTNDRLQRLVEKLTEKL